MLTPLTSLRGGTNNCAHLAASTSTRRRCLRTAQDSFLRWTRTSHQFTVEHFYQICVADERIRQAYIWTRSLMQSAHDQRNAIPAKAQAGAKTYGKERFHPTDFRMTSRGKQNHKMEYRFFLVRDDEPQWKVCFALKLRRHGNSIHLAVKLALVTRQNMRHLDVSMCSRLHKNRRGRETSSTHLHSASLCESAIYR